MPHCGSPVLPCITRVSRVVSSSSMIARQHTTVRFTAGMCCAHALHIPSTSLWETHHIYLEIYVMVCYLYRAGVDIGECPVLSSVDSNFYVNPLDDGTGATISSFASTTPGWTYWPLVGSATTGTAHEQSRIVAMTVGDCSVCVLVSDATR